MGTRLLVQMAGHAGSGKSTTARQLAVRIGGTVLDLDTIKTALLDAELDWDAASAGSYATIYALVDDLLGFPGAAVVVDTPSYWPEIHQRLTAAADAHAARYVFVECEADESLRARRLADRPTRRSQMRSLGANPVDASSDMDEVHRRPIHRPTGRKCIRVDTEGNVDLDAVLAGFWTHGPESPAAGDL